MRAPLVFLDTETTGLDPYRHDIWEVAAVRRDPLDALAPPWDSEAVSRAVGVNPDDFERHTAMGDVRWAMAIYDAVMGGA